MSSSIGLALGLGGPKRLGASTSVRLRSPILLASRRALTSITTRTSHAKRKGVMFITSSMFQMLVRYGVEVPYVQRM